MVNFSSCDDPACPVTLGECHCGCGRATPLIPTNHHIPKPFQGRPRLFVHGHNQRGKLRPDHAERMREWAADHPEHMARIVAKSRELVAGRPQAPEQVAKWKAARIANGNWALSGPDHPMWRGGRSIRNGYVYLLSPGHPFVQRTGYVKRARLVAEGLLRRTEPESPHLVLIDGKRYLRRSSEVHHRNEDKQDDRAENLQVLTRSEHARLHGRVRRHVLRKRTSASHGQNP